MSLPLPLRAPPDSHHDASNASAPSRKQVRTKKARSSSDRASLIRPGRAEGQSPPPPQPPPPPQDDPQLEELDPQLCEEDPQLWLECDEQLWLEWLWPECDEWLLEPSSLARMAAKVEEASSPLLSIPLDLDEPRRLDRGARYGAGFTREVADAAAVSLRALASLSARSAVLGSMP